MSARQESAHSLSNAGQRRKRAILAAAEQALGQRIRTRRSRRALASLALLLGSAAALAPLFHRQSPALSAGAVAATHGDRVPGPANHADTRHSLDVSPSGPPRRAAYSTIDDDELLAELAALGHDIRVVRVNDEARLVTSAGQTVDRARFVQPPG